MNQKALTMSLLAPVVLLSLGATSKPAPQPKPENSDKLFVEHYIPFEKTITVAVIDTGLDIEKFKDKYKLCKQGHRDFTGIGLVDNHGHGTHISGLINDNAGDANYCQVILKYFDPKADQSQNLVNVMEALQWAIAINVDVINFSGGGLNPNDWEKTLIQKALDKGITVVVAAGNEQCDMDKKCTYYPAMYDAREYVVGNWSQARVPAESSNYGNVVNTWELGTKAISYCKDGKYGCQMTGTSQATAIHTGKIINRIDLNKHINQNIDKVMILIHSA